MRRKPMLLAAAIALSLAVSVAPAAVAASPTPKSVNRKVNAVSKRVTKVNSHVNKAAKAIAALAALNKALTGKTTDIGASLATALAGVPVIVDGLTQLKDGLTTLAGVVSTQIGPGLTKLGDAYQAVEYGRAKVLSTGVLAVVQATTVTSSDIPDDGNPAVANGTALFQATASTASTLDVVVDVRSNESDNNAVAGQTGPVGQAGGSMYVKDVSTPATASNGFVPCTDYVGQPAGNPGVAGTPPGASIVTPSGTVTTLQLVNIPNGKLRTDTTDPGATSQSIFPAACTFTPAAGHLYEVSTQVNFVDIPTTTTPGPKE